MPWPRRLTISALVALIVPGLLLIVGGMESGVFRDASLLENAQFTLLNWGTFIAPQLFVLILGYFFPDLRFHFAPWALIALTVLFTSFTVLLSLSRDPNSFMLMVFYFPLSVLVLLAVSFF